MKNSLLIFCTTTFIFFGKPAAVKQLYYYMYKNLLISHGWTTWNFIKSELASKNTHCHKKISTVRHFFLNKPKIHPIFDELSCKSSRIQTIEIKILQIAFSLHVFSIKCQLHRLNVGLSLKCKRFSPWGIIKQIGIKCKRFMNIYALLRLYWHILVYHSMSHRHWIDSMSTFCSAHNKT